MNKEIWFQKAVITGVSGFIGSHIAARLVESRISVKALVRSNTSYFIEGTPEVETFVGDVRDKDSIRNLAKGADVIFHSAALVTPWVRNPADQYLVNVHGTQNVLEVAESFGIPVVCSGSIVVLDPFPPPFYVRLLDGNHYVKSKRIVLEMTRRARERGVSVSTVFPSGVVGPHDHRPTAIGKLIKNIMTGNALRFSFYGGIYLVDVRDVAEAHIIAAAARDPSEYFLPGEYWSLDRLHDFVCKLSGQQTRTSLMPFFLVVGGAAVLVAWSTIKTHTAPVLTPAWAYYFHSAASIQYPDDSAILGIRPRAIESSLADTVSWFAKEEDIVRQN